MKKILQSILLLHFDKVHLMLPSAAGRALGSRGLTSNSHPRSEAKPRVRFRLLSKNPLYTRACGAASRYTFGLYRLLPS